ncbi:fNIP repeat-containing protein [Clostridium sp. CAG:1000]|nr:fNIP repeat-containing protein [Clostridium sp. CAG:1000]
MDVVIPEKISGVQVKGIGHSAFEYDCGSDNIVLPTTSFNKYNIKQMAACSRPIGINSVILPEGLEYIGYNAFEGNNLKTVTIPSTVTEIHMYAFGSNQLQSVIFKGDRGKIKMCKSFKGEKHSDTVNAIEDTYCD